MSEQTINYIINITGNANDVVSNLNQHMGTLTRTTSQTLNVFSGFHGLSVAFQGLTSVVQNVQSAIGGITRVGANAELQLINMKTLFGGNADAATDMYNRISQYGKVTPYDKAGLIDAQKTMMSFGISGEKSFETLKQIGDIAMGDKQKMQSLSLAFAQMSSTGKLTGQDLLQMINAGFNPLNEISKKTGESVSDLKEAMSKGAISADMVSDAFATATSEGGLFYKAIDEASQTTAGKMAAIQDTIDEIKVSIFNATGSLGLWADAAAQVAVPLAQLAPLFTGLGVAIRWCRSNWSGFTKAIRTGVLKVGLDVGIMKYSIISAGGAFKLMSKMATNACRAIGVAIMNIPIIGWIAAIIAAIISVVTLLWNKSEGFRRLVMGVWESIKAVFQNVWIVVKTVFDLIWNNILKPYFNLWKSIFVGLWEAVKWCFNGILVAAQWLWDGIVTVISSIGEFFSKTMHWIIDKLGTLGVWIKDKLVDPIRDAFANMWNFIKGIFDKIISGLGKLVAPIKELWNKIFPKDKFSDIGSAYAQGAAKGSESWRKSQNGSVEDINVIGDNSSVADSSPEITANTSLSAGNLGGSAGTSAGKAQQITINLGNMVGTMNFNGGVRENARDIESILTEQLARILGMAETAV
ncbi:MAG: tape measure protein [Bacteroidales bacterium]|nr:tape measure protein [Bacteroidales bacterium]